MKSSNLNKEKGPLKNKNHKSFSNKFNQGPKNSPQPKHEILYGLPRSKRCLYEQGRQYVNVRSLDLKVIFKNLAEDCNTIEHQIVTLRGLLQLTDHDNLRRYLFTQLFLECLHRHHKIYYEGILFGSSINGLGFHDSDVDLRLRPLMKVSENIYEPIDLDETMVLKTLRDIAYKTSICCPSIGQLVPSSRCPVAKLKFTKYVDLDDCITYKCDGLSYDVSLSSRNHLGAFNSKFLRFLCHLEPKFHLLASVLRFWSNVHGLIIPGYLSSYALVNMLIFFCQTIEPPLLPTVDKMREAYLLEVHNQCSDETKNCLTRLEWSCMISLKREFYSPSKNTELLSVLLLKFFEFCLTFPYATHIITIRPGKALTHEEFASSSQHHPKFPIRTFLNIQDPFDFQHNITSGIQGTYFKEFLHTIRLSYQTLFQELLNNFRKPKVVTNSTSQNDNSSMDVKFAKGRAKSRTSNWGLLSILTPFHKDEAALSKP